MSLSNAVKVTCMVKKKEKKYQVISIKTVNTLVQGFCLLLKGLIGEAKIQITHFYYSVSYTRMDG